MATEWYVRVGNTEHGPFSSEVLKQLASNGKVARDMPVKRGAAGNWVLASAVKGLFTTTPQRQAMVQPQPASVVSEQPEGTNDSESEGTPRWIWGFVGAAALFLCGLGLFAVWSSRQSAEQAQTDAANQKVQQAVEKAQDWIRDGRLADADAVEQSLKAAQTNSLATKKEQVGPALAAVQKAKQDRWAAEILKSADEAISQKQFDKAQTLLRMYLGQQYGTERQKAETLLAEIALATSDDDAMRTLLAMDNKSFDSFSKGNIPAVVLSHPVLVETRIATLKKNRAEAVLQREEKRKIAEAERIAKQKRVDDEREASQRPAEEERLAQQAKQEGEKTIPHEVLRKWDVGTKFGMNLLVSERASRQDILSLAESLTQRYHDKYFVIDIFHSREAWRNREDDDYPEKDYWQHYLVQIGGEWRDGQEVHWVAEGRDH